MEEKEKKKQKISDITKCKIAKYSTELQSYLTDYSMKEKASNFLIKVLQNKTTFLSLSKRQHLQ